MIDLRQGYGRALHLAVAGGGPDSWIGRMHPGAAEYDGRWRVVAGVVSSDAQRSRAAGAAMDSTPRAFPQPFRSNGQATTRAE